MNSPDRSDALGVVATRVRIGKQKAKRMVCSQTGQLLYRWRDMIGLTEGETVTGQSQNRNIVSKLFVLVARAERRSDDQLTFLRTF